MRRVLLIGGSPCAGKSTVSELICKKFNFQYIKVDDYMDKHIKEANEIDHPKISLWKTTPWHELFSREVETQFNEEVECYHETWHMLKRDILEDANQGDLLVEGCGLLPKFIHTLFEDATICYMVPEEAFQVEKYASRDWAYHLLKDAKDPKIAFDNWMARDMMFAKYIKDEAEKYNYPVFLVDGSKDAETIAKEIMAMFNL